MQELDWTLILGLGATGVLMALVSCLVGMKARVEMPAWWVLYAVWVVVVLKVGNATPFRTILFASIVAGVLHASVQCLLLPQYIRSNPWYAEQMKKPTGTLRRQFLISGVLIGAVFGALVAGIAWWIARP